MRQQSYLRLLLLCACVLGCDSTNPVAPTGSVLTIVANPTQISLNGTSAIVVTGFRPDGNPLNPGTTINLSTTLGVLDVSTIQVADGRAVTTLRPDGRRGMATITATLPTAEAMATVDVQIGDTDETKPTLTISANPTSIGLNQTATVSVLARNADASNFGAGGRVRLRTSLGTLDDEDLVTDSNGEAETTLRPGNQTGTATVTGTIESSDEATVDISFGQTPETRPSLLISANPGNVGINQSSAITILVRNADGTTFTGSGNVRLRTTLGGLSNETPRISSGEASATLTNDTGQSGTATVTATFEASDEATVEIQFEVPILTINAGPDNIALGESSTISVLARNPDGSLVNGATARLRTTLGSLNPTDPQIVNGEATSTLTAGDQTGNATVTATVGSSEEASVGVEFGARPEDRPTVDVTPNPSQINIEQTSTIRIDASASDGSPLESGTILLSSTLGTLENTSLTLTEGSNGVAETTLFVDSTNPISGTATITASVGSSDSDTADVTILRTVLIVNANPAVVDVGETSEVEVQVRDERNALLTNGTYQILLTANLGTFEESSPMSFAGVASTTYTAGTRPGSDQIEARLGNADPGLAGVTIRDFPATIIFTVDPVSFTPNTAGTDFTLTTRVTNSEGEPLPNEVIGYTVSDSVGATFDPAAGAVTDVQGIGTSTMTIRASGIPDGLTQFTIIAVVRGVESDPVTIRIE